MSVGVRRQLSTATFWYHSVSDSPPLPSVSWHPLFHRVTDTLQKSFPSVFRAAAKRVYQCVHASLSGTTHTESTLLIWRPKSFQWSTWPWWASLLPVSQGLRAQGRGSLFSVTASSVRRETTCVSTTAAS